MDDEVIILHIQNKYCVVVSKIKNGCLANYPENKLLIPASEEYACTYQTDTKDKMLFLTSRGERKDINIIGYEFRFIVLTDIIQKAVNLKISRKLILPFDGLTRKPGIFSLLPKPKGDMKKKEDIIYANYQGILDGSYTSVDADKDGIVEGFSMILSIVESKGL